jgi:hypothetical protein
MILYKYFLKFLYKIFYIFILHCKIFLFMAKWKTNQNMEKQKDRYVWETASSRSRSTPGASNKHDQNLCSWAHRHKFCIIFAKVLDVPKEEEWKVERSQEYKNNNVSSDFYFFYNFFFWQNLKRRDVCFKNLNKEILSWQNGSL